MSTLVADHAKSTLNGTVGVFTDGTITLNDATSFPDPAAAANPGIYWVGIWNDGTYFDPADDSTWEEALCTAKSGNDLTVWRPNPTSHLNGARVRIMGTVANLKGKRRLNVRDFGATGDGTTDDTAAVQKAFEFASSGDEVYFPVGSYVITARINVTVGVLVSGDGNESKILNHTAAGEDRLFNCTATNTHFRRVSFASTGSPVTLTIRHIMVYFDGLSAGPGIGNCSVCDCFFPDLDKFGAIDIGTASTLSEYCVLFNNVHVGHFCDNVCDKISGCAAYLFNCSEMYIERNDIDMIDPIVAGCLYHVHLEQENSNVWIRNNRFGIGLREGGGAVDLMSNTDPPNPLPEVNKRIWVEDNLFDGCRGDNSGSAVLRCLSVEGCWIERNTFINCDGASNSMIRVAARSGGGDWQPGAIGVHIKGNEMTCAASLQRGIDIDNQNPSGLGGRYVEVVGNCLLSDGTNYWSNGIRYSTIDSGRIDGNIVEWKYDAAQTVDPIGILITQLSTGTCQNVKCINNTINGFDGTGAAGDVRFLRISPTTAGECNHVIVDGNTFRGTGNNQQAIRLETNIGRVKIGPNNTFELTGTGTVEISGGSVLDFEDRLVMIGDFYVHVDNTGRLRIGSTRPATEASNTIVGTQS